MNILSGHQTKRTVHPLVRKSILFTYWHVKLLIIGQSTVFPKNVLNVLTENLVNYELIRDEKLHFAQYEG